MDTNQLALLLQNAIDSRGPTHGDASQTLLIVTLIIAAAGPILAAIAGFIQSRSSNEARRVAKETAVVVDQVHTAVNSGRTAMIDNFEKERAKWADEMRDLREEVLRITRSEATASGHTKGVEDVKSVVAMTPGPPPAPINIGGPLTPEQIAQLVAALNKNK